MPSTSSTAHPQPDLEAAAARLDPIVARAFAPVKDLLAEVRAHGRIGRLEEGSFVLEIRDSPVGILPSLDYHAAEWYSPVQECRIRQASIVVDGAIVLGDLEAFKALRQRMTLIRLARRLRELPRP